MIYDNFLSDYKDYVRISTNNEIFYDYRYFLWIKERGNEIFYTRTKDFFFPYVVKYYGKDKSILTPGYQTPIGNKEAFEKWLKTEDPFILFIRHNPVISECNFVDKKFSSYDIILRKLSLSDNIKRNIKKGEEIYTVKEIKSKDILIEAIIMHNEIYKPTIPFEDNMLVSLLKIWKDDALVLGAFKDKELIEISVFIRNNKSGVYITNIPFKNVKNRPSAYLLYTGIDWVFTTAEYIHLGGGRGQEKDTLYKWKLSWGGISYPVYHTKMILDERKYKEKMKKYKKCLKNYFPPFYSCV